MWAGQGRKKGPSGYESQIGIRRAKGSGEPKGHGGKEDGGASLFIHQIVNFAPAHFAHISILAGPAILAPSQAWTYSAFLYNRSCFFPHPLHFPSFFFFNLVFSRPLRLGTDLHRRAASVLYIFLWSLTHQACTETRTFPMLRSLVVVKEVTKKSVRTNSARYSTVLRVPRYEESSAVNVCDGINWFYFSLPFVLGQKEREFRTEGRLHKKEKRRKSAATVQGYSDCTLQSPIWDSVPSRVCWYLLFSSCLFSIISFMSPGNRTKIPFIVHVSWCLFMSAACNCNCNQISFYRACLLVAARNAAKFPFILCVSSLQLRKQQDCYLSFKSWLQLRMQQNFSLSFVSWLLPGI